MNTSRPKRRHRRFQFSLRTLLIAVFLISLPLSWFAVRMEKASRQKQAVEAIEKAGGHVVYDYQIDDRFAGSRYDPSAQPPVPKWARVLLGDDFFFDVVSVAVEVRWRERFRDDEAIYLKELTSLERLNLNCTTVTDAGLEHLAGMNRLTHLSLGYTQITDAGLEHLKGLRSLGVLGLSATEITDAGLEHLERLTDLRVLGLKDSEVTPEGVKRLQEALPDCEIVY